MRIILRNVTFSGNAAPSGRGAAIYHNGDLVVLRNTTIANHDGGDQGVLFYDGSNCVFVTGGIASCVLRFQSALISRNTGRTCGSNRSISSSFSIQGGTILDIEDPATCGLSSDIEFEYPELITPSLVADRGTLVHPLLPFSVAKDFVPDINCYLDEDQRGVSRPQGARCDSGAYEIDLETMSLEDSDLQLETATPQAAIPTLNRDALCWEGPGSAWETVSSVLNETEVEILGVGALEGWLVIDNPRYPGVQCWLPEERVDHDLDLSTLQSFAVPPLPTDVPVFQGCMHQDQNENQASCHVPCPANPTDGTACNP